jgi:di/tricarboxylate transporter
MTGEQSLLCAILVATVVLFAWGKWRHDVVAVAALLASVIAGLVPTEAAFAGFGHPAVITVACVLVLSRGLQTSGAVDALAQRVLPETARPTVMVAVLTTLAAVLSGFMNNVGALALLMPIALKAAQRMDMPPGRLLMPLAAGSILGGMTTLIGTPPNLIVAGYRREVLGEAFGMFDFTPVGLAVAVAGVAFISLIGWRMVPGRKPAGIEGFESGAYFTEARVPDGAKAVGMTLRAIEDAVEDAEIQVLGMVRGDVRLRAPSLGRRARAGDVLILEADPDGLGNALAALGIKLEEAEDGGGDSDAEKGETNGADEDRQLVELVVTPNAALIGRSAKRLNLRARFGINLLAISREDTRRIRRLGTTLIKPGDVLLMQGPAEAVAEFASDYGCLPLAERSLRLPDKREMWLAVGILLGAVVAAASGVVAAPVAFLGGVFAAMVTRVVPARSVYDAVDWPVIVLLACLLPVAGAMLTTGAADVMANFLVDNVARGEPILALGLVLIVTMTLSDVMNNAATVAVMAPIAVGAAASLQVNPDAFFMAVAIGGSCAFLTPIGHQNNTLILGPGGFRFGDYWRLGLALEVIVVAVGLPMVVLVWGF